METKRGTTAVWAIDPFDPEGIPPRSVARELAEMARRSGLELLPTYVLAVVERQWETGELPRVPELQADLERLVSRFALGNGVRPARLIVDESGHRAGAVQSLLDFAAEEGAEWIAVCTHGRWGVERLILGSFAERLVSQSLVPVVFLPRNPTRTEALATRVALFPTDLSVPAHAAFTQFLPVASRLRLKVALFHALHYPVPSMDFGLGPVGLGPQLPETFVKDQADWANAIGAHLVEEARMAGVKARFTLHAEMLPAITGKAVLAAARRERARLIVMPSLNGPVTHFVAGSVAQEVFRSGRNFTWLYGPKAVAAPGEANAA